MAFVQVLANFLLNMTTTSLGVNIGGMAEVQNQLNGKAVYLETRKAEEITALMLHSKADRFGAKEWFTEDNINEARTYHRSWAQLQEDERENGEYKAKNIRDHIAYLTRIVAPVNGKELTTR